MGMVMNDLNKILADMDAGGGDAPEYFRDDDVIAAYSVIFAARDLAMRLGASHALAKSPSVKNAITDLGLLLPDFVGDVACAARAEYENKKENS